MKRLLLLTWLLLGAQDPAALIEQLRSEDIAVREQAFSDLEKLGAGAEVALKKAAGDSDHAVARDARHLLRILDLDRLFSPALKRSVPGIVKRIALDESRQWTETYIAIHGARPRHHAKDPYPELKRSDLEPLAVPAFRHAATDEQRRGLCAIAAQWHHRSVVPELIRILENPETGVGEQAMSALLALEGRGVISLVLRDLPDLQFGQPWHYLRDLDAIELEPRVLAALDGPGKKEVLSIVNWLSEVRSAELIPRLEGLLDDSDAWVRETVLERLVKLSGPRYAGRVIRSLGDSASSVRAKAAQLARNGSMTIPLEVARALAVDTHERVRILAAELASQVEGEAKFGVIRGVLGDPNEEVRRQALRTLCEVGRAEHAEWLVSTLKDEEASVRALALGALGKLKGRSAATELRAALDDERRDIAERIAALEELARLGAPPDAGSLIVLVEKAPIQLSLDAARLVVTIAPDRLTEEHISRLLSESEENRQDDLAEILAEAKTDAAAAGLIRMFDLGYEGRIKAARGLRDLGIGRMAPLVMARLKQEGDQGRRMAAQTLGNWGWSDARELLASALDDPDGYVKLTAASALDRIGLGDHAPKLRRLLSKGDWIASEAAEILARHGDKESIPELRNAMKDSKFRLTFAQALFDLGDRELVSSVSEWIDTDFKSHAELSVVIRAPKALASLLGQLESRDAERRSEAASLVGRWGDASVASRLLPLLAEHETSEAAINALESLSAQEVVPELVRLLEDPSLTARTSAVTALARLAARGAAPAIRPFLTDPDAGLRRAAAFAAGALGDREAGPGLLRLLDDRAHSVRLAAIEAVEILGLKEATAPLMKRLDDLSKEVRTATRYALFSVHPAGFRDEVVRRFRDPLEIDRLEYLKLLSVVKARDVASDLVRLLDDPAWDGYACMELASLGVTEVVPEIKRREHLWAYAPEAMAELGICEGLLSPLQKAEVWTRARAASVLIRKGERRFVPLLLDLMEKNPRDLFPYEWRDSRWDLDLYISSAIAEELPSLNAIRNPEAWKRFDQASRRTFASGPVGRVMAALASDAGFRIDWDQCSTYSDLRWRSLSCRLDRRPPGTSIRVVWAEEFFDEYKDWSYILENDVIRIVRTRVAFQFWKQWWADEQAKKK